MKVATDQAHWSNLEPHHDNLNFRSCCIAYFCSLSSPLEQKQTNKKIPPNLATLTLVFIVCNSDLSCCVCLLSCFSHVQLFAALWTVACQPPLSMGFSRQEYWSGLSCPPPGHLPNQGINPGLPHCRWILYHLNYQGRPCATLGIVYWWFLW